MTNRNEEIRAVIRGALSPIVGADDAKSATQAAFQDAASGATTAREGVMAALASASAAGDWTDAEIDAASRAAVSSFNDKATQRSLGTYMGEARRAMRATVRDRFADIVALRDTVWAAEKADKDGPWPCKAAFARSYHMLTALLSEAGEGRIHDVGSVIAFARTRDPANDPVKVAKRLADIANELRTIAATFKLAELAPACKVLDGLDADALEAAIQPAPAPATVTDTTVVQTRKGPVKAVTLAEVDRLLSADPAPGAVDILDDMLSDFVGAAAA